MSSSSVFSSPEYRAKLPKTTFPMTQEIDFSSVAGTLLPVFCDFMAPGEKYSGHAEMFTRTNELQTAAFAKIDEYIEYFFVPAHKLNQVFGEWFFDIDDRPTTLRPASLPLRAQVLPNISYSRLNSYMTEVNVEQMSSSANYTELSKSESMIRMMQHYRYDVYHFFDDYGKTLLQDFNVWAIPLVPFQAYQAIYYDYYRDSLWQNNDVEAYNTDDWMTTLTGDNISSERIAKIFQLHQRRQNADYYTGSHPSPLQNQTGILNMGGTRESALLQVNQWLQESGVSYKFLTKGTANTAVMIDQGNSGTLPVNISGSATLSGTTGNDYERWNYLDGLKPSTTPEGVLVQDDGGENGAVLRTGSSGVSVHNVLKHDHTVSGTASISSTGSLDLSALKTSISSVAIRTMFALEKLAQITGRAGKHYDDQVYAHYGVKISSAYSNECQMIGQQHSTIEIGEIVSPTTVPDGSVAGEIVGKGYGNMTGNKVVDFTAPCHGYFMAIYSAVPRRLYTPCGNPREYSKLYRYDFAMPELMNLGQQPLFGTEFNLTSTSWSGNPIVSWNWRYMEDKCRVGMAIGALSRFNDDRQQDNGVLADWSIQYPIFNGKFGGLQWYDFQVMPSAFNSIMLLPYDRMNSYLGDVAISGGAHGKVARLFDRDPLFHRLTFKLYKTSYMSTFGEPRID